MRHVGHFSGLDLWFEFFFCSLTLLVVCREELPACNNMSDEVLAWLPVWIEMQMICIWTS